MTLAPDHRFTKREACVLSLQMTARVAMAIALVLPGRAPLAAQPGPGPAGAAAYAVVVGSNRGGPGQGELRYAEDDAHNVAQVLTELGGYPPGQVQVLLRPGRAALLETLAEVARRIEQQARAGEKTLLFFYYSGHARAQGLNLGPETIAITELRERLLGIPATVTVTVLDACQSGAFSRVKGAEPTADFSFNSVTGLSTAGIAVMASSGGSELSQESDRLRSSFFTHHLVTGLRGVGDADHDGQVTLAEAYRYAYHRTLVDTASTAVGTQHVTLETGLRGKGEVVLTYPARASAQLELPPALAGDLVIERRASGTVVAELHKAGGEPLRLGLPAGEYRAVLREQGTISECPLALADGKVTLLDRAACVSTDEAAIAFKGDRPQRGPWALELGLVGRSGDTGDAYLDRLRDFGFAAAGTGPVTWELSALRSLAPSAELLATFIKLDDQAYTRTQLGPRIDERQRFSFAAYGLGLHFRALARMWDGTLNFYLQAGAGVTLARTKFVTGLDGDYRPTAASRSETQWFWGSHWAFANGLQVLGERWGFYLQGRYVHAQVIENLLGELHDSGGFHVEFGVRRGW
jgi:hypothetical protein